MNVALVSDIHGNFWALREVFKTLPDEVDQILFLGDLCGYYPFVEECISLWDTERIIGVRGNHDQVLWDCLQSGEEPGADYQAKYGSALNRTLKTMSPVTRSILEAWPVSRTLRLNGTVFALYHGTPWDPLEGRVYPDYEDWERFSDVDGDFILLGHTHYPFVKQFRDKLIVNPGSVGQPRDRAGISSFAIIDTGSGMVQHHRIPFDSQPLIEDALEYDPSLPYLVEVLVRQ